MGTLMIWLDPTFMPGTQLRLRVHFPSSTCPTTSHRSRLTTEGLGSDSRPLSLCFREQRRTFWLGVLHTRPHRYTVISNPGGIPTSFRRAPDGDYLSAGFTNPDQITMTVLATPTNQTTFFQTRLLGTQFANEACAVYLGTGGNCIVYSVTCLDPVTGSTVCPMEPLCSPQQQDQCIDIDSTFYTSSPISPTNADFLEAEPIGSNNWMSIFFSVHDPTGRRHGVRKGQGLLRYRDHVHPKQTMI